MFKIRCSAIGQIMTGEIGLTETQSARLAELQARDNGDGKPLTDNMKKELAGLVEAQKNPQLPLTVKTYLLTHQKELIYGRKYEIATKYTNKGLAVEDAAIEYASELLGWGFVIKNEDRFEDEHMTGTPDVILSDCVVDIKCCWDCFTFPLFDTELPNKDYYWQLQGYMALTGKPKAQIVYPLMDTPYTLIEREAYYKSRDCGYEETDQEILEATIAKMTYGQVPDNYKIKVFDIEKNDSHIQKIRDRVELCRQFLTDLNKNNKQWLTKLTSTVSL